MRPTAMLAVTAALSAFLLACERMPAEPALDDADELALLLSSGTEGARANRPGGGSVFEQLHARIDGFGGMYRVAQCHVVLVLTKGSGAGTALQVARSVIEPLVATSCPSGIQLEAKQMTFTWAELMRFHALVRPHVGSGGVLGAFVDYALNAVVINVADAETGRRLQARLVEAGVPAAALSVRIGSSTVRR
jgi:hypothetical protein